MSRSIKKLDPRRLGEFVLKLILSSPNSPLFAAIAIIFVGLVFAFTINREPFISTVLVIVISILLAFSVLIVSSLSFNDGNVRLSSLTRQQYYEYEVLRSVMEWEILNPEGSDAIFRKNRTIRFLGNGIETIREYIWGDEYYSKKKPLKSDFIVSPGEILDIYREGGKYVVIITLDHPYKRMQTLDIYFERRIHSAFTGDTEWVEYQPVTNTKNEVIKVVFPPGIQVKEAYARFRYGDYSTHYKDGEEGFSINSAHEKVVIQWDIKNPKPRASYLIEWTW